MKRIFLFLSSFIIAVGAAGAIYVLATGNADTLREKLRPGTEVANEAEPAAPVDAAPLLEQATDYFLGVNGVEQSDEKGAALVKQAADANNQRAIGLLGTLYLGGIGVEQDMDTAAKWLALSNDIEGQELAANLLNFQSIVSKLPPEEKEKQIEAANASAKVEVRASFIQALQELRAQKENTSTTAAVDETAPAEGTAMEALPENAMEALPEEDSAEEVVTEESIAPTSDIGDNEIPAEDDATGIDGMEAMEGREAPPSAAE